MSPVTTSETVEMFRAEVVRHFQAYGIPIANGIIRDQTFDFGLKLGLAFEVFSAGHEYELTRNTYRHPATWWSALLAAIVALAGLEPLHEDEPDCHDLYGVRRFIHRLLRPLKRRIRLTTVPVTIHHYRVCPHIELPSSSRMHVDFLLDGPLGAAPPPERRA